MTESKLATLLISIKFFSSTIFGKVSSTRFVTRYQADKSNFFYHKAYIFSYIPRAPHPYIKRQRSMHCTEYEH